MFQVIGWTMFTVMAAGTCVLVSMRMRGTVFPAPKSAVWALIVGQAFTVLAMFGIAGSQGGAHATEQRLPGSSTAWIPVAATACLVIINAALLLRQPDPQP